MKVAAGRGRSGVGQWRVVSDLFAPAGTALDFALNRVYDPSSGRWLNRDPIGEAGGTSLLVSE